MLWHGVTHHGIAWVKDWIFTPDNWLFSLVPIHFAEFALFGMRPGIVIYTGWAIFVASTVTVGLIARTIGLRFSSFLIPLILIFAGLYANQSGFVSYSTSHNTTNLFGLLALLAFASWVKQRRAYLLGTLFILQLTAGLSDPWLTPAYTLPLTLTSLLMLVMGRKSPNRGSYAILFLLQVLTLFLVSTQLFGWLSFLPRLHFAVGDWHVINSNAIYFIKDLGGLFNVFPGEKSNAFLTSLASLATISFLYTRSLRSIVAPIRLESNSVIQYSILFSIGGISTAFLISNLEAADYSARFLINILYLAPVAIGAALEPTWVRNPKPLNIAVIGASLLFIVSGVYSNFNFLKRPGFSTSSHVSRALTSFLSEHHLRYGYGPYWGTQANALTAITNWNIILRPVVFDNASGRAVFGGRGETSSLWYKPEDMPTSPQNTFLIVTDDGENCTNIQVCLAGVAHQFGHPAETLIFRNYYILVWDHALVNWQNKTYIKLGFSKRIEFNSQNSALPGWAGWSHPEPWGTWSDENSAFMYIDATDWHSGDLTLLLRSQAYLPPQHPSQEVRIYVNEHLLSTLRYGMTNNLATTSIRVPAEIAGENKGRLAIRFEIIDPVSPRELGISSDNRRLGIGLIYVELAH